MAPRRILLAVSGGVDSMYLAHRAPELFPGASFAVAHCNFHLRGAESDGDEAFVREKPEKSLKYLSNLIFFCRRDKRQVV